MYVYNAVNETLKSTKEMINLICRIYFPYLYQHHKDRHIYIEINDNGITINQNRFYLNRVCIYDRKKNQETDMYTLYTIYRIVYPSVSIEGEEKSL